MNVIISYKFKSELKTVDLPIGKELIGQYIIDDIINSFSNFQFSKLIIDLSTIKDKDNLQGFQRMASMLNMNNIIFYIDGSNDNDLIAKLIPFGIYNFANSPVIVKNLIDNPNSYKDVAHYHVVKPQGDVNVAMNSKMRIIGFKNLTTGAGATTLIYMSKKYLENLYRVLVVEVNKTDFEAFKIENHMSIDADNFLTEINKVNNFDIVLVDLNDSNLENMCSEVLYLMEPSIIKLDNFSRTNINFGEMLKGKKVVLNKSFLTSDELSKFEYEGKFRVFFNLPPINERQKKSEHIIALYKKIGLDKKDAKKVHKNR